MNQDNRTADTWRSEKRQRIIESIKQREAYRCSKSYSNRPRTPDHRAAFSKRQWDVEVWHWRHALEINKKKSEKLITHKNTEPLQALLAIPPPPQGRQRIIDIIKRSDIYNKSMSCKIRPETPEPTDKYSKRGWDRRVVQWKRALQHVTGDYLTFE